MKREYDFRGGKRGAVVAAPRGKTRITIRLIGVVHVTREV